MPEPPEMTSDDWAGCSMAEIEERAQWIVSNAPDDPKQLEYECYDAMISVRARAGHRIVALEQRVRDLEAQLARRSEWGHGEWTDALPYLYADICLRAEYNMERTGTVSGAHWNAFRQFLEERGLLEEAEQELQRSRETTE